MKNTLRTLTVAGLALLMAGCALPSRTLDVDSQEAAQKLALERQIDDAIERVRDQPRWSSSADDRAQFASFATDAVSVSYQGSAQSLLKAIAAARGKTFRVTGPEPHTPVFVFVQSKGVKYLQFVQDLDKQFGQRAQIVLTDDAIEMNYRH